MGSMGSASRLRNGDHAARPLVSAPGDKHWHGAAQATGAVHIALNVDAQTTWQERVTDEQYGL